MKKLVKNDTEVSYKKIISIAVPIVLSSFSTSLMAVVDRSFVSNYDLTEFTAVMTASTYAIAISGLFLGIISYMSYFISQYYGAREYKNCTKTVIHSIYVSCLFSLLLLLITPLVTLIFNGLGHSEIVVRYEKQYFYFILAANCVNMFATSLSNLFKGIGKTRIILVIGILANVINIFLDWALIFGRLNFPELGGIAGGGLATLLSTIFALICYIVFFLLKQEYRKQFNIFSFQRFDFLFLKNVFKYSIPTGLQDFIRALFYSLCLLIISMSGEVDIASANIVFTIEGISILPILGITTSVAIIVAQEKGAKRDANIPKVFKKGIFLLLIFNFIIMCVFYFFPKELISIFSNDNEMGKFTEIMNTSIPLMKIMITWIILDSVQMLIGGSLRALGDTKFFMTISMIYSPIFYIIIPFVLVKLSFSITWIWWSLVLFTVFMFVTTLFRYFQGQWKNTNMISE